MCVQMSRSIVFKSQLSLECLFIGLCVCVWRDDESMTLVICTHTLLIPCGADLHSTRRQLIILHVHDRSVMTALAHGTVLTVGIISLYNDRVV